MALPVSPEAKISASTRRRRFFPKFRPAHGGADFRQNFGQHTTAQVSPKIRPAHGGADFAPNLFFETVTIEQGFMTEKDFTTN